MKMEKQESGQTSSVEDNEKEKDDVQESLKESDETESTQEEFKEDVKGTEHTENEVEIVDGTSQEHGQVTQSHDDTQSAADINQSNQKTIQEEKGKQKEQITPVKMKADEGAKPDNGEEVLRIDGRDENALRQCVEGEYQSELSIYKCLTEFTNPETLEGANGFACPECARRLRPAEEDKDHGNDGANGDGGQKNLTLRKATKQMLIHKLPKVLTLHIKRFKHGLYGLKKASDHVKFPLMLAPSPFCTPPQQCKEGTSVGKKEKQVEEEGREEGGAHHQYQYRLCGVSVHGGGMGSGHYIAYVLSKANDKWYYFSDSHGREAALSEVLSCEAYVLFYERV